jgi:hypothetical protein
MDDMFLNQRFGRLKVIALAGNDTYLVRCGDHDVTDQPKLIFATKHQLLSGQVKSCGCAKHKTKVKNKVAVPA